EALAPALGGTSRPAGGPGPLRAPRPELVLPLAAGGHGRPARERDPLARLVRDADPARDDRNGAGHRLLHRRVPGGGTADRLQRAHVLVRPDRDARRAAATARVAAAPRRRRGPRRRRRRAVGLPGSLRGRGDRRRRLDLRPRRADRQPRGARADRGGPARPRRQPAQAPAAYRRTAERPGRRVGRSVQSV
ncbi:MAG: hypothetical protein AVDCRST_MAG85-1044, partial [uncultured Solirubrobacteraceae bacterium]